MRTLALLVGLADLGAFWLLTKFMSNTPTWQALTLILATHALACVVYVAIHCWPSFWARFDVVNSHVHDFEG